MLQSTLSKRTQRCAMQKSRRCSRRAVTTVAGLPEFFRELFDFNSWAPRSTKIWRLNQYAYTEGDLIRNKKEEELLDMENQIREAAALQAPAGAAQGAAAARQLPAAGSESDSGFSQVADSQIASALGQRVAQVASLGPAASEMEEGELAAPLSGGELRKLIATKYGKTHDVSIVRRDIPGKTLVSLNIMWNHMEQRSFQLTERQYMEKLDSIALVLTCLRQAPRVRSALRSRPRAERGLPARPVVGTAISIRLPLDDAVVQEWFGSGYQ